MKKKTLTREVIVARLENLKLKPARNRTSLQKKKIACLETRLWQMDNPEKVAANQLRAKERKNKIDARGLELFKKAGAKTPLNAIHLFCKHFCDKKCIPWADVDEEKALRSYEAYYAWANRNEGENGHSNCPLACFKFTHPGLVERGKKLNNIRKNN